MKRLIMGALAFGLIASGARAQAPFADVPREHWAYDAVNTLAQRGLVIGYPDGTFGGKRAMTRYEFAVVIARMIPQLEQYIRDEIAKATPRPGDPPPAGNWVTQEQFDALRRLVEEFGPELQALRVDVDNLRRDLDALSRRVGILEEQISRVKVTGEMNVISRHSATDRDTLGAGGFFGPTDIDNRPLNPHTNLLEASQLLYDLDLGITARVSRDVTANAVLNVGNYGSGFIAAPFSIGNFPYGGLSSSSNGTASQVSPYKVYIEAPISLSPLGLVNLQVGKTGVQFTPYSLKLVDFDSYTNITRTDNGEVVFTGGKANFRFGGVGFTAYAGTHGTARLGTFGSDGGFTGSSVGPGGNHYADGYPVIFGGGRYSPSYPYSFDPVNFTVPESLFPGLALIIAPATQSTGIRGTLGTPFGGTLGLTYIDAGINDAHVYTQDFAGTISDLNIGSANVWGADLALNLTRGIGFTGEYSRSTLYQRGKSINRNGVAGWSDTGEAFDGRINFGIRNLALSAGYRRIEPYFMAPGAWGAIGRWKNPTNIEGWVGTLGIPLARSLSASASYESYNSIVSGSFSDPLEEDDSAEITRWTAGLKFGLTSASRVDLGIEVVEITPGSFQNEDGAQAREVFYNLGWGTDLSKNTSFKVLYQIIQYDDNGAFLLNDVDTRGSVGVAQFTAKF